MKVVYLIALVLMGCKSKDAVVSKLPDENIKSAINLLVDNWHENASNTNFDAYFNAMASDGVFIGTDASENWTIKEFKDFAKPYFDKGKAWSFTALERNIYISKDQSKVWFDELLDTQMELCRGSGVLVKEQNTWKIAHYVLSLTIPNEKVSETIKLKKQLDSIVKKSLLK